MTSHEKFMQRCLDLASKGMGMVAPNPLVGSVIVHSDCIIGEGWHQKFGGPHAEVLAIKDVKDEKLLKQSTLYVNLEPCAHFGKTPPCADLIIQKKIPKVVVGIKDPFESVAGKGIQKLIDAGVEVIVGVLNDDCATINKRFITYVKHKRPYIILKWAQTEDGFIAPIKEEMSQEEFEKKRHITGLVVQKWVHKWRSEEDAIMVGTKTIQTDNPSLNVRAWRGRNPVRITIDKDLRLDVKQFKFFDGTQQTIVFTGKQGNIKIDNCTFITIDFSQSVWPQIFDHLYTLGIQSLIIEGGTYTIATLLEFGLWDEAQIITTPTKLVKGVKAPYFSDFISQKEIEQYKIDRSILNIYKRT